jgi:hypothetical protein
MTIYHRADGEGRTHPQMTQMAADRDLLPGFLLAAFRFGLPAKPAL